MFSYTHRWATVRHMELAHKTNEVKVVFYRIKRLVIQSYAYLQEEYHKCDRSAISSTATTITIRIRFLDLFPLSNQQTANDHFWFCDTNASVNVQCCASSIIQYSVWYGRYSWMTSDISFWG